MIILYLFIFSSKKFLIFISFYFRWSLYYHSSCSFPPKTFDNHEPWEVQNHILQNIHHDQFGYMVLYIVYFNSTIFWIWSLCCRNIWNDVSNQPTKLEILKYSCKVPTMYLILSQVCTRLGIQWSYCLHSYLVIYRIFDTIVCHYL